MFKNNEHASNFFVTGWKLFPDLSKTVGVYDLTDEIEYI